MEDIENYTTRETEILDSIGRFVRIYDPGLRCENGSFLKCEQGNNHEVGKVVRQVGTQRFDVDLLGARLEKGPLSVSLLEESFSVKIETTSMHELRWTKGSLAPHTSFPTEEAIFLDSPPIDNIAPIKRGATHLVFYDEARPISVMKLVSALTTFFRFPALYCTSDILKGIQSVVSFENNKNENGLDVFAAFTHNTDLAWLDCRYSPEFSKHWDQFEKARNPTTTVVAFIKTSDDVFPIIESLRFGNIEALWVIDEKGRLDPMRTRTRVLEGDNRRATIMNAIHEYKEAKFEADLLGDPFEEDIPFPEIWEPIF